jgi:Holliday junction resolvase RusA-like endonuclease
VVRWKQTVTLVGASSIRTPLAGPLAVSVHVVLSRPKSHYSASGKLRNSAPSYPSKSDVDNYAKAVLDALNKTAWEDDSQIVELRVTKRYSDSGAQCGCFVIISEPAPELAG